jgi:hypothetical protein
MICFDDPDEHAEVLKISNGVRITQGNFHPTIVKIQTHDQWMFVFDTEEASSVFHSKLYAMQNDITLSDV